MPILPQGTIDLQYHHRHVVLSILRSVERRKTIIIIGRGRKRRRKWAQQHPCYFRNQNIQTINNQNIKVGQTIYFASSSGTPCALLQLLTPLSPPTFTSIHRYHSTITLLLRIFHSQQQHHHISSCRNDNMNELIQRQQLIAL